MNIKLILAFTAGTGVGVGGSFIFFKRYFEKKAEKEIAEMREWAHECKKYGNERVSCFGFK